MTTRRFRRFLPPVAWSIAGASLLLTALILGSPGRRPELSSAERPVAARDSTTAPLCEPVAAKRQTRGGDEPSSPAEETDSELSAARPESPTWHGQVVARRDGTPIVGAWLELREAMPLTSPLEPLLAAETAPMAKTRSDAAGRFAFEAVPPSAEAGWLLASAAGFSGTAVTLSPAVTGALRIELEEGRMLRGRVVAADDGRPLEGVRVSAFRGGAAARSLANATTDHVGWFELAGLPEDEVGLACLPPGRWRGKAVRCDLRRGDALSERIELATGGVVGGRVLLAHGEPASGARVTEGFAGGKEAVADREGRFRLDGVATPAIDLYVRHPGAALVQRRMALPESLVLEGVDIVLDAGRTIRGRVLDATGAPVPGAKVAAEAGSFVGGRQQLDLVQGSTSGDGRFELAGVRSDLRHDLRVASRGFATLELALVGEHGRSSDGGPAAVDAGDLVLTVESRLCVRRTFSDGTPAMGVSITLIRDQAPDAAPFRPRTAITDTDGCARFDRLGVGSYRLLDDPRQPSQSGHRVSIAVPGEQVEVDLPAAERSLVEGTVEHSDGAPAVDVAVEAFGADGERVGVARTGRDGRFRLRLVGDRFELRALPVVAGPAESAPARAALAAVTPDVTAAGSPVRLRLPPARWVGARVVDPNQRPWAWARLARFAPGSADPSGSGGRPFTADRDGRFVCALAPDEACDVVAVEAPQSGPDGKELALRSSVLRLTAAENAAESVLDARLADDEEGER
jgi:hypothetical protein